MGNNDFGNFLYRLRRERGVTQAQLADELGLTNKAVSKWETGEAYPETAQLLPLASYFGVTTDELLKGRRESAGQSGDAQSDKYAQSDAPAGTSGENSRPPRRNPRERRRGFITNIKASAPWAAFRSSISI